MKKSVVVLLVFVMLAVASCAGLEEHKGATTGAAVGAGLGGLIGAATASGGDRTKGAIMGALLGGLVGGAIGHYAYDQKRTQTDTNNTYGYKDSAASIRIEAADVNPRTVKRGEKIDTRLTYAVLTTSNEIVTVKETREIFYGSSLWGNPETSVDRQGGTYQSSIPIFLPNDMQRGTYKVRYTIQTATAKDTREASFTVQ
jgi:surface antigen